MLDRATRAWYDYAFRAEFLRAKGEAFQDLFAGIMERRYPTDYKRMRPWGNIGDRKNDGYMRDARKMFQIYAPSELTLSTFKTKLQEDYDGACKYWKDDFDNWIFVHNSFDGLGPNHRKFLDGLAAAATHFVVAEWGYVQCRAEALAMSLDHLIELFGLAPTVSDIAGLQLEKIDAVVKGIAAQPFAENRPIRPVPSEKIKLNGLSDSSSQLIEWGWLASERVRAYFTQHADPLIEANTGEALRSQYLTLKANNTPVDEILNHLLQFVGVGTFSSDHHLAALTVIAFYFEHCTIFEGENAVAN